MNTEEDVQAVLADFDPAYCVDCLVKAAKDEGYTVRQINKPDDVITISGVKTQAGYHRWSAKSEDRGVRYVFESEVMIGTSGRITRKSISVDRENRDERGRYRLADRDRLCVYDTQHTQARRSIYYGAGLNSWREWLAGTASSVKKSRGQQVTDPIIKGVDALNTFTPLNFSGLSYICDKLTIEMRCFYKSCTVKGIATILPNLKVSVQDACKPGADTWFYITGECLAKQSGANPEIIVQEQNGELVFYPVRGNKVTNEFKPTGTYIDYTQITKLDEVLVQKAIAQFLKGVQ